LNGPLLDVVVVGKFTVEVDRVDMVDGTVAVINAEAFAVDEVDVVIESANVEAGLPTGAAANVVEDVAAVVPEDGDEVIANTVEAAVEIVAAITDDLNVEVADAAGATVTAEPAVAPVVVLVVAVVAAVAAVAVKEEFAALRRN
jgi:hypothetical protein